MPTAAALDLTHPALAGRTGRGISVAVVDSGINPAHPHVGGVSGGVWIARDGRDVEDGEDYVDVLGHGTAVAAAIHEKAPDAQLFAVRVFEQTLATSAGMLVRAIDWAASRGIRLINLSLGTAKAEREGLLQGAVQRAASRGALIVSAAENAGERRLPGGLAGVIGVVLDWDCPRDELRLGVQAGGRPVLRASGYPRPIPGVPPERNLHGISFAVANATAWVALLLEGRPDVATPEDVLQLLG